MTPIMITVKYNGKIYDVAKIDMWGDQDQATCDLASNDEEIFDVYLSDVELIKPMLISSLEILGELAEKVEYMHNFQNERGDIVEYIYKTDKIMRIIKGDR